MGQPIVDLASLDLTKHVVAEEELRRCLPWLDWDDAEIQALDIDRAEPATISGRRPDQAFAERSGNLTVCWPTKLTLTPDLGDRLMALLPPGQPQVDGLALPLPSVRVGTEPW